MKTVVKEPMYNNGFLPILSDTLPKKGAATIDRTVVTLFHLEEFNYKEIEGITDLPQGTVKSYLHRARQILKEKLKFVVADEALIEGVLK